MIKCKGCYMEKDNTEILNGRCNSCRGVSSNTEVIKPKEATYSDLNKIILTTETNSPFKVEKRLGIITSECVIGLNIFKDFFSGIRDIIGGRNNGFQKGLKQAKELVLNELKKEAHLLNANAVIAVDLKYSEISGGGKSMLFVVATGTAIKTTEN